jgi:hypothetical protein
MFGIGIALGVFLCADKANLWADITSALSSLMSKITSKL